MSRTRRNSANRSVERKKGTEEEESFNGRSETIRENERLIAVSEANVGILTTLCGFDLLMISSFSCLL